MGNMIQQLSNTNTVKLDANMVQNAAATPFVGHYTFTILLSMENTKCIVDSDASNHVCSNVELLFTTFKLDTVVMLHLPDGSSRAVRVKLNNHIVLENVLHVLGFTHNLISVAQLIKDLDLKCIFYKTHCIFQRSTSDHLLGVAKMKDNLCEMDSVCENYYCNFFNQRNMSVQDWHIFLGHPSITAMKHMHILKGKLHTEAPKVLESCDVCIKLG